MIYWHEIDSFKEYGFYTGYYTFDEVPARADFSPFDTHGPSFVVLIGIVARIFGWQYSSMLFINLLLITSGLTLFILFTRPNFRQMLLLLGLVTCFWSIPLFMPFTMQ